MGKRFDYKKKSNRFLIAGIIARVLDPTGIVSDVLLCISAANAAADMYWHPGDYAELIENTMPMPYEEMSEEDLKSWQTHNDKMEEKENDKTQKGENGDVKKSI